MEINGVTHPVPTEYAKRIYSEGKTVFISKKHLGRAKKGSKFVIYESQGARAYTGWADVISIEKMKPSSISRKYKNQMILTPEELKEYAKNRAEMNVIVFENFEKFQKPVVPKRFISVGGKYIYETEFNMIKKNKD